MDHLIKPIQRKHKQDEYDSITTLILSSTQGPSIQANVTVVKYPSLQMVPSFFVILVDPTAHHLPLPPDVVSNHLENKIREGPVMVSANGGYWWRLRIKRIDGSYCFTNGWHNVVQDIQLGLGDFLYFRPLDQSNFRMSVHSPNGCEKVLPPKVEHAGATGGVDEDKSEEEKTEKENDEVEYALIEDGDQDDDPYFTLIITKTYTSLLRFPVEFARLVGIDAEGTMMMKNRDGKEWHVSLRMEISHGTKRYYLATGWGNFQRENGISEGDKCIIKFLRSEGKLLLTKITCSQQGSAGKRGRPAKQPQPSVPVTGAVERKRRMPGKTATPIQQL